MRRLKLYRAPDVLDSQIALARLMLQHTGKMQRIRGIRIRCQQLSIHILRLVQAALPMQRNGAR
jgi:hypothetical protein